MRDSRQGSDNLFHNQRKRLKISNDKEELSSSISFILFSQPSNHRQEKKREITVDLIVTNLMVQLSSL